LRISHLEREQKPSLLIVVGSSSALAQDMVPNMDSHDSFVAFSTRNGSIEHGGNMYQTNLYDSTNYESLKGIFDSSSLPTRSQVGRVSLISFTGAKDSQLFIASSGESIQSLLSINFTVNAFFANLVIQKYRGVPISMVFISSAGALTGDVGSMIYSSAKHALNGLAKGIAIEYGRFQITANVVSLGVLSLGMKNSVPEKRLKEMIQKTSTRTHVKVENVLSTIRFVLSNSDINGAVIPCDGGYFT